ncbi:MAG: hydroxymethylbilane synthase [Bacillota bacterium]|nr:hydroxymethylbilane synthase [Bacillota bacterium]
MRDEVLVGSRGSALALEQTRWVIERLKRACPRTSFRVIHISTTGDNILDVALAKIGDRGLFTKEIEKALLDGTIDIAVHSMKDVPTALPAGLVIGAVTAREDPGDALVSRDGHRLEDLPPGARVGTSSLRRQAQFLAFRPDLNLVAMRGNLHTRLRKLDEGQVDALVLARAGLKRLGLENRITQPVSTAVCLPAVGQGALGVEARADDAEILGMLRLLEDPESRVAVEAERALLARLEGGCQVPIGALARFWDQDLVLEAVVSDLDGRRVVRTVEVGPPTAPAALGERVAEKLLQLGAREILAELREGGPERRE